MSEISPSVWTRRIADEFWSGPVTPLTFSLLAATMAARMVREPLEKAGLHALAAAPVFHRHASHVYVNAGLLAEVVALLPPALRSEGLLDLLPSAARRSLPATSWAATATQVTSIVGRLLVREPAWAPWQRAAAFDRECARLRGDFAPVTVPPSSATPESLLGEIARIRARLGDYLAVVSWGVVFAYVFYHLTGELARRWAPGLDAERAALTVGLPGVASLEVHRELGRLGMLLAAEPALLAATRAGDATAAWRRIASDHGAIGDAFGAFLARHGHRMTGRDLLHPTWREAPEVVVSLASLDAGATSEGVARDEHAALRRRIEATRAIERALGGGPAGLARRAVFHSALAAAQRYAALRENMRYHADYVLARLRALVLAIGDQLAARGRIAVPLDLCFLTFEEIGMVVRDGADLAALVTERRAAFTRDGLTTPPQTLGEEAATPGLSAPTGAATAAVGATLAGEAGAPGRCRARARVVRGPDDFGAVERGDVIVAAYADPGWTPVLELASGIILEAGGQLSHGAIVAREFGIPALVSVAQATRAIRDGDIVELDAATGLVTIVARA